MGNTIQSNLEDTGETEITSGVKTGETRPRRLVTGNHRVRLHLSRAAKSTKYA